MSHINYATILIVVLIVLLVGFCAVIAVYFVMKFLATLIPSLWDSLWVNHQLLVPSMEKDRAELSGELARLRTAKWKNVYCTDLINDKVRLTGHWPDDRRPKFSDDVERSLAILDCESLDNYNYRF